MGRFTANQQNALKKDVCEKLPLYAIFRDQLCGPLLRDINPLKMQSHLANLLNLAKNEANRRPEIFTSYDERLML